MKSLSRIALLGVGLVALAGCGGSEKIIPVSGVVTRNGQPVAGLVVSFVPDAPTEAGVSTGETDEHGAYTLMVVKSRASGAVAGKHKVWVSVPRAPLQEDKDPGDDKDKEERAKLNRQKGKGGKNTRSPSDIAAILKVYGRLDSTPLAVEVKDGKPIDLKLD